MKAAFTVHTHTQPRHYHGMAGLPRFTERICHFRKKHTLKRIMNWRTTRRNRICIPTAFSHSMAANCIYFRQVKCVSFIRLAGYGVLCASYLCMCESVWADEVKVKPLTHVNVNLVHLLKVRSLAFWGRKKSGRLCRNRTTSSHTKYLWTFKCGVELMNFIKSKCSNAKFSKP